MRQIEMLQQTRRRILRSVEGISTDEALWIPAGFRNNILWNLGHIVVVQQLFHYKLAGQPLRISDEMVALFRAGTSPGDWDGTPDLDAVLTLLETLPRALEEDYGAGRLSEYQPYKTSSGIEITSIESALVFNSFHEGLHTGIVQSMRRAWSQRAAADV